jgi:hypothetical protein
MLPEEDERQPLTTKADEDEVANRTKLLIEIWKQAVDTQKHFNDMCVKRDCIKRKESSFVTENNRLLVQNAAFPWGEAVRIMMGLDYFGSVEAVG